MSRASPVIWGLIPREFEMLRAIQAVTLVLAVIAAGRCSASFLFRSGGHTTGGNAFGVGGKFQYADGLSGSVRDGDAYAEWSLTGQTVSYRVVGGEGTGGSARVFLNTDGPWNGPPGTLETYGFYKFGNPTGSQTSHSFSLPSGSVAPGSYQSIWVEASCNFCSARSIEGTFSWRRVGEPKVGSEQNWADAPPILNGGASISIPVSTPNDDVEEGAVIATDTTGAALWGGVVDDDVGLNSPYYVSGGGLSTILGGYRPDAYYFKSVSGLGFTSFVTPEGIPGSTGSLVIDDGESLIPYIPGTTHVFDAPLQGFALRGLDAGAMPPDNQLAPFAYGVTFHEEGPAIVYQAALAAPRIPGDFNDDGIADGDDLLLWQRGLGVDDGSAVRSDGDANGDGNVDSVDYGLWLENFGDVYTPEISVATTSAPEPAGAAMILAILVMSRSLTHPSRTLRSRS